MVSSPALHRLALQRKYSEFIERVASHPEDVTWTDRYGNTALHILCSAQQRDDLLLKAIESIIFINPAMIAQPNHVGWTPMHHASTKRLCIRPSSMHNDVLLLLMEKCPSAVSIPSLAGYKRMTPFHIACEANADYIILKRMLQVDPTLATRPCVEQEAYAMSESPISLIWKHNGIVSTSSAVSSSSKSDVLDKMALLLLAAYHGRVVELPNHHCRFLLHAACCQRVPRAYISHLLSDDEIKQQASMADESRKFAFTLCSPDCFGR